MDVAISIDKLKNLGELDTPDCMQLLERFYNLTIEIDNYKSEVSNQQSHGHSAC